MLGCGAVGSVVARLAAKLGVAEEVVCFDKNPEKAKVHLDFDDARDLPLEEIDVSDQEALKEKISGFDFAVNALPTFIRVGEKDVLLNPLIMQACLKSSVPYIDLACYGGKRRSAEQLTLAKSFRSEGLLAVINAGASPGLTNLLAREAYEDFDRVSSIRVMSLEDQKGPSFLISWSREEMLNVATPVLVYRDRRYMMEEPFKDSILCDFPDPAGTVRCYTVSNDESYTIPLFLRTRSFEYYAGGSDIEILRALYRLGILEEKTIMVRGRKIPLRSLLYQILKEPSSPREFEKAIIEGELDDAFFGVRVTVEGEVAGEKAVSTRSTMFPSQRKVNELLPGATYITYPTGLIVVSFVKALRGRKLAGVFPAEALPGVIRRSMLDELENNKVFVNSEFKVGW